MLDYLAHIMRNLSQILRTLMSHSWLSPRMLFVPPLMPPAATPPLRVPLSNGWTRLRVVWSMSVKKRVYASCRSVKIAATAACSAPLRARATGAKHLEHARHNGLRSDRGQHVV